MEVPCGEERYRLNQRPFVQVLHSVVRPVLRRRLAWNSRTLFSMWHWTQTIVPVSDAG
jgi:hypothetical protein